MLRIGARLEPDFSRCEMRSGHQLLAISCRDINCRHQLHPLPPPPSSTHRGRSEMGVSRPVTCFVRPLLADRSRAATAHFHRSLLDLTLHSAPPTLRHPTLPSLPRATVCHGSVPPRHRLSVTSSVHPRLHPIGDRQRTPTPSPVGNRQRAPTPPPIGDRLLDSALHAAHFVSLIAFERSDTIGAASAEIWQVATLLLPSSSHLPLIYLSSTSHLARYRTHGSVTFQ